ncbi:MAG TPA: hypothetical protein DIT01_01875 [Lentisphaeria bacterium]|nr:hypothetical protein [Lentisphaeria bacterium]|tara:strand:- start:98 stop:628 length:531 start_codon:yes stop_codon:yes gene_type:complete
MLARNFATVLLSLVAGSNISLAIPVIVHPTADVRGEVIAVEEKAGRTIVDVRSAIGIGRMKLSAANDQWPTTLVLRLHLRGLESLHIGNGTSSIDISILSYEPHRQLCEVVHAPGERRQSVDEESPFWMPVQIKNTKTAGQPKMPLLDGYFEVTLPAVLLKDNPQSLSIRWIDFYR